MCLLQSSHTSSTAFFYFCMNTDTPIFALYFENSPTHGFLHGKSLWKAAFTAGQYTDVSESLIWMKQKKFGRHVRQGACEGQIHRAVFQVPLKLLYTSPAQKLKNCCRKHTTAIPHMGTDRIRVQVLRNLLLWRDLPQQCRAGKTPRRRRHPPCSPCASPALNETFKVFRKWVIRYVFGSTSHWDVYFFFFLMFTITEKFTESEGSEAELLSLLGTDSSPLVCSLLAGHSQGTYTTTAHSTTFLRFPGISTPCSVSFETVFSLPHPKKKV